MEKFHSECGAFITHRTVCVGESPHATYVVTFYYEKGEASYDGKVWAYKTFKEPRTTLEIFELHHPAFQQNLVIAA